MVSVKPTQEYYFLFDSARGLEPGRHHNHVTGTDRSPDKCLIITWTGVPECIGEQQINRYRVRSGNHSWDRLFNYRRDLQAIKRIILCILLLAGDVSCGVGGTLISPFITYHTRVQNTKSSSYAESPYVVPIHLDRQIAGPVSP